MMDSKNSPPPAIFPPSSRDNLVAELRAEHARVKEPLQFKWPRRELFKKAAEEIERLTAERDSWVQQCHGLGLVQAERDRLKADVAYWINQVNQFESERNKLRAALERMRPHLHAQWKDEIDKALAGEK